FANANLANPCADRCQHDIHDPDPTDQQHNCSHSQQHQSKCIRGLLGHHHELSQVGDVVYRFRPMPPLNYTVDLSCSWVDHGRISHRKVDLLHGGSLGEIPCHRIRNHHSIGGHFRLAEGIHPLFEGSDNRERQSAQLDHSAHGLFRTAADLLRHLLRDYANLVVRLFVLGIEEPSCNHHQVSYDLVLGATPK